MKSTERLEFANDVRAAVHSRAPRTAWMQIVAIAVFLSIAAVWAHWATLDEVTSGEGRVIPSSKLQVVQTLDGGIVLEVFVREGDIVEPGQLLLRIDDTEVSAKLGELTHKSPGLRRKRPAPIS
jgi:adhesin transport system membrane fusion protein